MTKKEYEDYLKSSHWKIFRKKAQSQLVYNCFCCKARTRLSLHHITYSRLGNERPFDVVWLCQNHHKELHKRFSIGSKKFKQAHFIIGGSFKKKNRKKRNKKKFRQAQKIVLGNKAYTFSSKKRSKEERKRRKTTSFEKWKEAKVMETIEQIMVVNGKKYKRTVLNYGQK